MLFTPMTYIGIDPTAGRRPFSYVALENDLSLLALGEGEINEVLAFVAGQRQAYVAVCAPRQPNQGLMEQTAVRERLNPPPKPGRWRGFRVAEYLLRLHNISCPQTGSIETDCPQWMQMGFALFRRLQSLGYQPYPNEASLQWLEVYPHASFSSLLGMIPFPKNSLEGRIQRQLILYDRGLHIPDPMRMFEEITRHRLLQGILPLEDLHEPAELDAMVAAYTAWQAANHPQDTCLIGEAAEGQVVLPVSELKPSY